MWAFALAFVAGMLTALSPCVLPVLPIVMGSATRSRLGPAALAAGFVTTFTVMGVVLASVGTTLGLSDELVRRISASLLVVAGLMLVSERLQHVVERWLSPLASISARLSMRTGEGLWSQFAVGGLLGGIWSPCVGPTLGAALALAARSDTIVAATTTMAAFGAGSASLLLTAGYASRAMIGQQRRLRYAGSAGRLAFGVALLIVGVLAWSGLDKMVESAVLARLPQWWVELLASA
jgi:cytochrome c-type biogenesis protein